MRVIQQMVTNDIVTDLSLTYQSISTLSDQLATGKQLNRPSDNPGAVSYAIDLQASVDLNAQYQSTSNTAMGFLQSGSSALGQVVSVIQRARQLAVQGTSDTYAPSDRTAMATEIQQLGQQVQQIGNTMFGSSYIFSGTMTQTTPFNTNGGFSGNNGAKNMEIAPSFNMQVNVTANQMFTGSNGVFETLRQLARHLNETGNPIPVQNQGSATLAVSGINAGASQGYLVQVTGVNASGGVTSAQYSNDGVTWSPATLAAGSTANNFTLGASGMAMQFTPGAVTSNAQTPPTVGDRYSFSAVAGANASGFAIQASPNVGNESLSFVGNYTGSGTPNLQVRASQLDSNNNVVGVQISSDNGTTWSTSIPTTTGGFSPPATPTAGGALTPTQFTLGNGLTLTWNQSTINANQVYNAGPPANADTFTYAPTTSDVSNDITALDSLYNTVSGIQAQLGAKEKTIQDNISQMQSQSIQLQSVLTTTVNVDYPTVATQMASAQTLYTAALSVDAKSIQKSLVDFLP